MLKDRIKSVIEAAITAAQEDGSLPAFEMPAVEISRPKQAGHGDYSNNVAMVAAASIRKATGEKVNPRQIAQAVVDHIEIADPLAKVEIAGPGFINIYLADAWIQSQVRTIIEEGEAYGNIDQGAGQRWQVEYVSANPTGPVHYGGARNAVLGDVLANALEAAGYEVQREYYVNDAGNQFELFAQTLYARYAQLLDQGVPVPEDGYQGEYMITYAQQILDAEGDRFLAMDRRAAVDEIQALGRGIVVDALQTELGRMNVTFDNWFSEQTLHDQGLVEQSLSYLDERGEIDRHDGAVWFKASNYPKNEKDEVVIKSDGNPTYFAADIAYHYDKFLVRKFDRVIDVWGVDHQGHVTRMAAMMEAFGLDPDRLTIVMHDFVKLVRDGQEVKLSKRAGNLVTVNDVVDEVGPDALRFNLLLRGPESTIEFDLDLAVTETSDNPVFYVQYSYARISSILSKARNEGIAVDDLNSDNVDLSLLTDPAELALIRKMMELEEQIELAIEKLSPHNLTHYAIDLAKTFTAFYRDCIVINAENPELTKARLYLSQSAQIVLAKVLGLLGINAPDTM
jgi:arginyl-tRNA synthetase